MNSPSIPTELIREIILIFLSKNKSPTKDFLKLSLINSQFAYEIQHIIFYKCNIATLEDACSFFKAVSSPVLGTKYHLYPTRRVHTLQLSFTQDPSAYFPSLALKFEEGLHSAIPLLTDLKALNICYSTTDRWFFFRISQKAHLFHSLDTLILKPIREDEHKVCL
jgi:hypothetical protein